MSNKLNTALLVVIVLLLAAQFFVDRPGRFQWHPQAGVPIALDTKTGRACNPEPKPPQPTSKVRFVPDPNQEAAPPVADWPHCVDLR